MGSITCTLTHVLVRTVARTLWLLLLIVASPFSPVTAQTAAIVPGSSPQATSTSAVTLPLAIQPSSSEVSRITAQITEAQVRDDVFFLASDALRGRDTGTPELDEAAAYIADVFARSGATSAPGLTGFLQPVPFDRMRPPQSGSLIFGDSTLSLNTHFVAMNPVRGDLRAPIILLEHASEEELQRHDVRGKIVVATAGFPGSNNPRQFLNAAPQKHRLAADAGAVGLIELFSFPAFPWNRVRAILGAERLIMAQAERTASSSESPAPPRNGSAGGSATSPNSATATTAETAPSADIPHVWINAISDDLRGQLSAYAAQPNATAQITLTGGDTERIYSSNVVGIIEGTDPTLRHEYLLLSAHYDHIGVVAGHPEPLTSDYIFNGARDNAVGTAAVMAAARYLGQHPPKRSIILAAWTAEEKGLLGSRWFAEHPPVPLHQIVYNLNIDGAGYNDTTLVTVIGLDRTDAGATLRASAAAFGLTAISDPSPEQGLFDRSDNVNFARAGIPAPTYSLGFTAFDDTINYFYHRVTDTAESIHYPYVAQYVRSYILAAQTIANAPVAPFWVSGDVYEPAGLALYGGHPAHAPQPEFEHRGSEDPTTRAQFRERAIRILESVPLVDGHNDVPIQYRSRADYKFSLIDLMNTTSLARMMHTDIPRLRAGRIGAQFWSVYVSPNIPESESVQATLEQIDFVYRMIDRYPEHFELALTADDIERIFAEGKIASLIGMEGGHSIGNSLAVLRQMYALGARYMSLTHSRTLDWADSATDTPKNDGLSGFGEEVVREMNRLGMMIDLSHPSAQTMRDAIRVSEAPVIFSHSSAMGLNMHPRNVPDDVLDMTRDNGGIVMMTFIPAFLHQPLHEHIARMNGRRAELEYLYTGQPDSVAVHMAAWNAENRPPVATLAHVADHIDYIRARIGSKHIGIGGDYDGIPLLPQGLEDVSMYPDLFAELLRRGYSDEELKDIAGRNLLRVMREVEQVSERLRRERAPSEKTIRDF